MPLVENGRYQPGDVVIETVAREYLEPLRQEGLDVLILGCTHYPLLTDIIREIMGPEVSLVNAGAESVHTRMMRWPAAAAGPRGDGPGAAVYQADRPEGSARWPPLPAGGAYGSRAAGGYRAILRRPSWKEM